MCLKELMLLKPMVHVSVIFVITGIFLRSILNFSQRFHDLIQKAMSFNNAAIVSVKWNDYRIHFLYRSKDEIINLLRNADLTEKKWKVKKQKFIMEYELFKLLRKSFLIIFYFL